MLASTRSKSALVVRLGVRNEHMGRRPRMKRKQKPWFTPTRDVYDPPKIEEDVLVSTPYWDHVVTPRARQSTQTMAFFDYSRFSDKRAAAVEQIKQEWAYKTKLDQERKKQEYFRLKLDRAYKQRVRDVVNREKGIQKATVDATRARKRAAIKEEARRNWIKDMAFRKSQRDFQKQYLLHERAQFWIESPEEITEDLFDTQISLTGFWPEARPPARFIPDAVEKGRMGPLPVVAEHPSMDPQDSVYLDEDRKWPETKYIIKK